MRIAVLLCGNLRTFFMPTRETRERLCDILMSSIVEANEADVFAVTDTTDFFLDGTQYFDEAQRAEVEGNPRRSFDVAFHHSIGFMNAHAARDIISGRVRCLFGSYLREVCVNDRVDVSSDPKYLALVSARREHDMGPANDAGGCRPERLVQQYLKVKRAGEMLARHEKDNGARYDIVFCGRFDNRYPDAPVRFASFDFSRHDVFVPGVAEGLLVYDWTSFGTRRTMDAYLNLYDQLGCTLDKRLYRCECQKCGAVSLSCSHKWSCECNGGMKYDEMTLASEYHLHRTFAKNGFRVALGVMAAPYRYR